jgi:hypothetical protein
MSLIDYNFAMPNAKTYLIGGTLLAVGLCGSSLNAANIKDYCLACRTPRDLDATTRSAPTACHFIPKGTFVVIERPRSNGAICVRVLGDIDCSWVYEGQVINR